MLQDAAVKKTALPPEKHLAFYKRIEESDGQHDYSVADLDGKGVTSTQRSRLKRPEY